MCNIIYNRIHIGGSREVIYDIIEFTPLRVFGYRTYMKILFTIVDSYLLDIDVVLRICKEVNLSLMRA